MNHYCITYKLLKLPDLIEPMGPSAKRAVFDLLVRMGFKEIEVGVFEEHDDTIREVAD